MVWSLEDVLIVSRVSNPHFVYLVPAQDYTLAKQVQAFGIFFSLFWNHWNRVNCACLAPA